MSVVKILQNETWENICSTDDLIPDSGICALVNDQQVAIFHLPGEDTPLYALGNWDPIGQANVMSRGILGSLGGELVVASPLYKQHYSLATGACLEQPEHTLDSYGIRVVDDSVQVLVATG